MTPLAGKDRATLEAGLRSLERQERELVLQFADALKSGSAARYQLSPGFSDQLREIQRTIRHYKLAMKRAEFEGASNPCP